MDESKYEREKLVMYIQYVFLYLLLKARHLDSAAFNQHGFIFQAIIISEQAL